MPYTECTVNQLLSLSCEFSAVAHHVDGGNQADQNIFHHDDSPQKPCGNTAYDGLHIRQELGFQPALHIDRNRINKLIYIIPNYFIVLQIILNPGRPFINHGRERRHDAADA